MYIDPTLTKDEFKDIHNALYDLDTLARSLEEVLKPEMLGRLLKAKAQIRKALKNAYDEDNRAFKERSDIFDSAKSDFGFRSIWSLYEVDDLFDQHPYTGAQVVAYKDHWGERAVSAAVPGDRWIDLWRAADQCIRDSGDEHHVFIEQFRCYGNEPTVLVLSTGS